MFSFGLAELLIAASVLGGPTVVPEPWGTLGVAVARAAVPVVLVHVQGSRAPAATPAPPGRAGSQGRP